MLLQFYHADAFVCMSENSNERRYDWVEYEDGQFLGQKNGQCRSEQLVNPFYCPFTLLTTSSLFFLRQDQGRQLVALACLALLLLPMQV